MTSDHLCPVLESEVASDLLIQVASLLAVRQVPGEILEAISHSSLPFLCALSTKAGCEWVAHILLPLTDLDQEATVDDGVGAHDLISRNAMLGGEVEI